MRLIYLPTFWTVFLDFAAWLVIHVGVVLAMVRVPIARFDPGAWIFRPRHWEKGGLFYVRRLRIKKWKKHLPDGARWLGSRGFPKTRLAEKGEEYLLATLDTDEGSRSVGEFAIGTNEGIQKFTGEILFDEKIGGSFHMALGSSYPESGGVNKSAIHWDMICDLRKGGEITVDGTTLYKNGKFTLIFD